MQLLNSVKSIILKSFLTLRVCAPIQGIVMRFHSINSVHCFKHMSALIQYNVIDETRWLLYTRVIGTNFIFSIYASCLYQLYCTSLILIMISDVSV